jgi:rubrerythrin
MPGKAKKKVLSVSEGLATAMQTEIEGYEFYKLVAVKSKDPGAREMFESLAADEAEHSRVLSIMFKEMNKTGKFKTKKMAAKSKMTYKSPVFSKEFLASKKSKNLEMSALSIGILLEQNSIEFYRGQQMIVPDVGAKRFFGSLAIWEGEHLRALLAQKTFLQRDIFAQARFEPF